MTLNAKSACMPDAPGVFGGASPQHLYQLAPNWEVVEAPASIDTACHGRMDFLIPAIAKQEGETESLKASDQMKWVGRMNNIHNRAEKIVLHELVYT